MLDLSKFKAELDLLCSKHDVLLSDFSVSLEKTDIDSIYDMANSTCYVDGANRPHCSARKLVSFTQSNKISIGIHFQDYTVTATDRHVQLY